MGQDTHTQTKEDAEHEIKQTKHKENKKKCFRVPPTNAMYLKSIWKGHCNKTKKENRTNVHKEHTENWLYV